MGNIRKHHSPSFKTRVVLELLREEKSLSQVAEEAGVHPTQLNRWRKQVIDNLPQLFAREKGWETEKAEYEATIHELYAEVGRLSTQLAWFKKKGIDVD